MTFRGSVLLLGAFLLTVPNGASPDGKTLAAGGKPGSSPQQPLAVSLLRLIATPEAFDGKYVRILGFVLVEDEVTAIYLHREDREHSLTKNGLWLAANDAAPEGSKEAAVNNRYALIEGRFSASKQGHLGLWSGSLVGITRMQPWPADKKAPPKPLPAQALNGGVSDPWVGSYTLYFPSHTLPDDNRKGFLRDAANTWGITKTKEGYRVKGCLALQESVFQEVRPGVLKNKDGVELVRGVCDFPGDQGRVIVQVGDGYREGFLIGPSELERKVQRIKVK